MRRQDAGWSTKRKRVKMDHKQWRYWRQKKKKKSDLHTILEFRRLLASSMTVPSLYRMCDLESEKALMALSLRDSASASGCHSVENAIGSCLSAGRDCDTTTRNGRHH